MSSAFDSAVQQLRTQQGGWAAPAGLPVHGVGHSNGALLHLLIGSAVLKAGSEASSSSTPTGAQLLGREQRASNVLISYNNFRVSKAVPVPLSLIAPAVQQLRGQGRLADDAAAALQQAAAAAQQLVALAGPRGSSSGQFGGPATLLQPEEVLKSLQQWDPAVVQLGSVFDEVGRSPASPPAVCLTCCLPSASAMDVAADGPLHTTVRFEHGNQGPAAPACL